MKLPEYSSYSRIEHISKVPGQRGRTPVRRVQMLTVRWELQIYLGHFVLDCARQRSISERGAVGGQARPLIEVLHFLPATTKRKIVRDSF